MLGPFSIDTYLPAFPQIERTLNASPIEVQQTLTAYMMSFSVMTLLHGALSDTFGRRNIILGFLAVFAFASLACAAVHSIEYLWAFRILQGMSAGAGVVIGRAIIRDAYSGAQAARLLSLVTMIFSIAPAAAPMFGGWIVQVLDWRSIFLFLFVYAVLLWGVCSKRLPETLPPSRRQAFSLAALRNAYGAVFRSRPFHFMAATLALNFSGLFLYVAAAPAFITRHLGLGPHQFGWQFVPAVAGIFLGALTANRLAGKMTGNRQIALGFVFLIGSAVGNVMYHALYPPSLPWSVLPLFVYTFGMSIAAPSLTLMVLDLFPHTRGTAASCQSFAQTMLGAVVAGVAAPLLMDSVLHLAAGQLALAVAGGLCWLVARKRKPVRAGGA